MEESDRPNLCLWHEDDMTLRSNWCYDHQFAEGEATLDIDSILTTFNDLSIVNISIHFSIVSNPVKNLQYSIYMSCRGIQLHYVSHFYLRTFGHDLHFDLFIMFLALHNSHSKRVNGNLHNYVASNVRSAFMTKCFLPSIREVLDPNKRQSWQFDYDIAEANAIAMTKEGNLHIFEQAQGRFFEVHVDLRVKYIERVWQRYEQKLWRRIKLKDNDLKYFWRFEFFVNAKGYKYWLNSKQWEDLINIYKRKVKPQVKDHDDWPLL